MLWHDLCRLLFGQYGETNASATSLASIVAEYREESWCLQEPSSESRFLHWLFGVIESRMMNPNAKSPFYELKAFLEVTVVIRCNAFTFTLFCFELAIFPVGSTLIGGQLFAATKSGRKSLKRSSTVEATSFFIAETAFLVSEFLLHDSWYSVVSRKTC